jgi:hypothetical protein
MLSRRSLLGCLAAAPAAAVGPPSDRESVASRFVRRNRRWELEPPIPGVVLEDEREEHPSLDGTTYTLTRPRVKECPEGVVYFDAAGGREAALEAGALIIAPGMVTLEDHR